MRRVIAIAIAGYSLAGCSSLSWDAFKATPPTVQVQLESVPQGADARTSLGPGCKTPCSVDVSAPDSGFSVTYTLNKFQPVTVPVQVIRIPGDFSSPPSTTIDPNPVVAELQPAGHRRRPPPRRKCWLRRSQNRPRTRRPLPPDRHCRNLRKRPHPPPDDCLHCTRKGADCMRIASCIDCDGGTLRRVRHGGCRSNKAY